MHANASSTQLHQRCSQETRRSADDPNELGHRIPIKFVAGLPYIEMRPITKDEFNDPNIPHVTMTPEGDWNPRIVDDPADINDYY